MSRAKLALWGVGAMTLTCFLSTSSAFAAVSFIWKVGGSELKAGESRGFSTKDKAAGKIFLSGTVGGAAFLLLSTKIKEVSGAQIIGGTPGLGEERVDFENVKVDKPFNCGVPGETIQTNIIKAEIVEVAKSGVGTGKVAILFSPKTGPTFDTFELIGASCVLKGTTTSINGSVLSGVSPEKTEAKTGVIDTGFTFLLTEYKNSAGSFKTAGLTFAGSSATGSGLAEAELVSGEAAGVF